MDEELDNVSVREGDLIVCEGGEPGRAAIWDKPGKPIVIQKALHRVRPAVGISPWYLAYRLAADASTGVLEKYFTGSTIKHFTGQSLRSYVFPLPPASEQRRIVAEVKQRLSVAREMEKAVEQSLKRAERLRQSILKRAFEGELVPQDPSDEPASVLLERIKAEKARQEREGKGKRKGSGRKRRKTEEAEQLRML
jgi:type I restriction enzyme S subunit